MRIDVGDEDLVLAEIRLRVCGADDTEERDTGQDRRGFRHGFLSGFAALPGVGRRAVEVSAQRC